MADGLRLRCASCGRSFPLTSGGRPDFRPTGPLRLRVEYTYNPEFGRMPWDRVRVGWPQIYPLPAGLCEPMESTERQMLRAIPPASAGARALDIGCGPARQRFREALTALGYEHHGFDIEGAAPDALADAHWLPLPEGAFDLLVTSAVFEHLKVPHVAMMEAARVAKPGALFLGSIAFLEPFHISYFHHSALAVYELLDSSGFECQSVILSNDWTAFRAQLEMGFAGRRLPAFVQRLIAGTLFRAALAPAAVKGLLTRSGAPVAAAQLAFARSHSASVGFIAVRRTDTPSRIVSRSVPADQDRPSASS